ncbi:MAG TPA: YceI family protein [Steroidobacteraceae bacterium]|nr:YceI family protein [Steroidobacteraceae bacterium]
MALKLKELSSGCKLRALGALFLAGALAGCPAHPPRPALPAQAPPPPPLAPHEGRPYDVVAAGSLVTVLVYRGGTLEAAGHNHLIAARSLSGTIYVPADPLRASFEVQLPVAELTVDEPQLRAKESAADFPPEVPESARAGTRRNMLGEALLDGAAYPEIVLRCERLEPGAGTGLVLARIEAQVRGARRSITVPAHYRLDGGELSVWGETPLAQSELGLTPFSALLGALQVRDEMQVRFRIEARAADARGAAAH